MWTWRASDAAVQTIDAGVQAPRQLAVPLAGDKPTLKADKMAKMEKLELDAQGEQLRCDVRQLVEKYRSIFEWDVPDIDQALSDRMIIAAIRQALDEIEKTLPGTTFA